MTVIVFWGLFCVAYGCNIIGKIDRYVLDMNSGMMDEKRRRWTE
jgi:hypothetical protein